MKIQFQKGEYPIKQVIFCSLDSVTGPLYNGLIKAKFGEMDIIHELRDEKEENDADLLNRTTSKTVSTCWSVERTKKALVMYLQKRGWKRGDVRIYEIVPKPTI